MHGLPKFCSSKTNWGVTTSLESAVFLLPFNASPSFIARCLLELQLLKIPSSRSCLSRSGFNSLCCKVMTPQHHRYTCRSSRVPSQQAICELSVNLCDAPTAAVPSLCDRTGANTYFESRHHTDPAMLRDTEFHACP